MKSLLIAITGPSGFRKGRLMKKLLAENPDYARIISYTDRPKRQNEIEGEDFRFVTDKEFTKLIESEHFVEWQMVPSTGYRYGKSKDDVEETLNANKGQVVFTRVNVINLPVFKRRFPDSKSIFIDVKDTEKLVEMLKEEGEFTDDEEFERRYKFATEERRRRHLADFTISRLDTEEEIISEIKKIIEKFRR